MKKILMMAIAVCMAIGPMWAAVPDYDDPIYSDAPEVDQKALLESEVNSFVRDGGVTFVRVPKKMDARYRIYVVNNSTYTVQRAAIAVVEGDAAKAVGVITDLLPGQTMVLPSHYTNKLKKLRGKTLCIKTVGVNEEDQSSVVTYNLLPEISELHHDLYITMTMDD